MFKGISAKCPVILRYRAEIKKKADIEMQDSLT